MKQKQQGMYLPGLFHYTTDKRLLIVLCYPDSSPQPQRKGGCLPPPSVWKSRQNQDPREKQEFRFSHNNSRSLCKKVLHNHLQQFLFQVFNQYVFFKKCFIIYSFVSPKKLRSNEPHLVTLWIVWNVQADFQRTLKLTAEVTVGWLREGAEHIKKKWKAGLVQGLVHQR